MHGKLWVCKLCKLMFTVRLDMRLSRMLYLYRTEWDAGVHTATVNAIQGTSIPESQSPMRLHPVRLRIGPWKGRPHRGQDIELLLSSQSHGAPDRKRALSAQRSMRWLGGGGRNTERLTLDQQRREACEQALDILNMEGDWSSSLQGHLPQDEPPVFRLLLMDLIFYEDSQLVTEA